MEHDISDKDKPLEEISDMMNIIIRDGGICFIKFTCQHCGTRQTCDEPNTVFLDGYSCEECEKVSKPEKFGLMAIYGLDLPTLNTILDKQ